MAERSASSLQQVDDDHDAHHLTYAMMLGIRTAVGAIEAKPPRRLLEGDFEEKIKFRFPKSGAAASDELPATPPHALPEDFGFRDFCPLVFRDLRRRFGIAPADYLLSVCAGENFPFLEFFTNSKSGAFFFYSHDSKFMIKTISHAESLHLRAILPRFYEFVMTNEDTLLPRFYGLHRVKYGNRDEYFLIMGNVFKPPQLEQTPSIHLTFDLKGALHKNRKTHLRDDDTLDAVCLKDLNFTEMGLKIKIGPERAALLKEQLKADAGLLEELELMDYSLLLGYHRVPKPSESNVHKLKKSGSAYGLPHRYNVISDKPSFDTDLDALDGLEPHDAHPEVVPPHHNSQLFDVKTGGLHKVPEDSDGDDEIIYFMGIIDILTKYGAAKKLEHGYKALRNKDNTFSCQPPDVYAQHFLVFLDSHVE